MEVTAKHIDQVKFALRARSHTVVCDQSAENDGQHTGMTPPEFLLASLDSGAAFYAVQYLKTRSLADSGVEVKAMAEKLKHFARLGNFQIHVVCPVALTEEQTQGPMSSVHHCLVHNALLSPPEIKIELANYTATKSGEVVTKLPHPNDAQRKILQALKVSLPRL